MAWEARLGLKLPGIYINFLLLSRLNGLGSPFEGRKYSASRIGMILAVFGELPVFPLVTFVPAPLPAFPSRDFPLLTSHRSLQGVISSRFARRKAARAPLPLSGRGASSSVLLVRPVER